MKHESSLLTQIGTEKIGLRAFLFQRKVPGIATPLCRCGAAPETAAHIILHCVHYEEERRALNERLPRPIRTRNDLQNATEAKATARTLVRWFHGIQRLTEYRLAIQLARSDLDS